MKKFECAIIVGWATYKTPSGAKASKDFTLGEVQQSTIGCLDLDNINKIIKSKYENFINNKSLKNQYKLLSTKIDIWIDSNTKKEIMIED